jgi:hypothetical protein
MNAATAAASSGLKIRTLSKGVVSLGLDGIINNAE